MPVDVSVSLQRWSTFAGDLDRLVDKPRDRTAATCQRSAVAAWVSPFRATGLMRFAGITLPGTAAELPVAGS